MVKSANLVIKFFRHIQDGQHFICAIAVHVHDDLTVQYACQCLQSQVAFGCLGVVFFVGKFLFIGRPVIDIFLCVDPLCAVGGHITHTGRWQLFAFAVDTLGVLATGHFHTIRGTGKLHALVAVAIDIFQGHPTATDKVA